ncbi:MAG: nicotinate phosphoribosyltransferase, partial [bacterium]|nr:nicotinate phosphoribosyltransferase [bacterium]
MLQRRRKDEPIITSLLDADFYTFTMQAFILRYHRCIRVKLGLTNRTTVRLATRIHDGELGEQL